MTIIPIAPERQCGTCTACCEGWLHSTIYGEPMYRGKPCVFVGPGSCSIYEERPHEPCVTYRCVWLSDINVPLWMKPSESGVILTWRTVEGVEFLEACETDRKMDSAILSWMIMLHVNHKVNIRYMIAGGWNWIGSEEFLRIM